MEIKKMTMGLIVGNRGFFPDHLAKTGREEMLRALQTAGIEVIALTPEESKYGAVETREDSRRCADLFKRHRERIDGIIVTLPNFGEERAIADTLRLADLRVPVLIQATPDDTQKMTIAFRRDSFCGKMSACNNLRQYGIPYSITTLHTEAPDSPEFAQDLAVVRRRLPRSPRLPQPARRRHRRPSHRLQHRALQRKNSRVARHLHRNSRPLRSSRPHRPHER